ncbi:chaperone NapD [Halomonas urumqiensis]|uniref:Chaperone NapD n=1 Tax=Halomonas urumqiensis TaxID=1684789 RepID=A0A2N7UJ57_9GAMM|nr:chaperone NapD [Halomonas urumqiensis]PMR80440.1 glutamate synthase [Halomonas urumqiensis]PTB01715.1 glutamate synthase [Halomonas urumqiensis]GHE22192.1 nitrate reductase [Halomonas urumqiensis]
MRGETLSTSLHITSLLIHVNPGDCRAVALWLSRQPGCEVSAEDPAGKLVLVMECLDERRILAMIDSIQRRPGVLGAALVYHEQLAPESADDPQETLT